MKNLGKKIIVCILAACMVLTMSGIMAFADDAAAGGNESGSTTVVINNDGTTKITDAVYDQYFDGTAEAGVEALLNAGGCYINGIRLPKTEDEKTVYQINHVDSLYKTDTGWGYNVHKTTSQNTLSFDEARSGLFAITSQVRGHQTTLYLENGKCTAINIESYEVVRLAKINEYGNARSIERGDFELETNRVRYDANNIQWSTDNFDPEAQVGDICVYWFGNKELGDGSLATWYLEKATAIVGKVTNPEKSVYSIGDWTEKESNVSRYNLINSSRPTQGYTAYTTLGLTDEEIVLWNTPNGMPIGFTFGVDQAASRANLKKGIANAQAHVAEINVSEDGEDVYTSEQWATQEAIDTFNAAIDSANTVAKANASSQMLIDWTIYKLSEAWQDFDKEVAYGEVEEVVNGKIAIDNDGSTMITDAKYDKYFEGTAEEGLEALLDAGKVSINGLALPATEDETELYQINLTNSLYKTETGWGYNVHKTTSENILSFEEARFGLASKTSSVRGHQTILTIENGICTAINIESFEVMKITYFEDHGGNVDKIDRGDFELETQRVRFDANKITGISDENFDSDIQFGDVVYFWYGKDDDDTAGVWHMYKADSKTGVVTQPEHSYYTVGDWTEKESNVSRYNLIDDSRPTQGYSAYVGLGIQEAGIEITLWNTPNGMPIGFSYGSNAKAALKVGVTNSEELLASVTASEDGEDVPSNKTWATQEAIDTFTAAVAAAKTLNNKNSSTNWEREKAIYTLYKAYSAFTAECGEGSADPELDEYSAVYLTVAANASGFKAVPLTDTSYDKYFGGTEGAAATALCEILEAGNLRVNGKVVPATLAEYKENGYTANGSAVTVADDTTEEGYAAAMVAAIMNTIPIGNTVTIYDIDADGIGDIVAYDLYAAFIAAKVVYNNEDATVTISRSDIDGVKPYDSTTLFTDGNSITLSENNVDPDLKDGDMGLAYETMNGWCVKRAAEANGILVDGEDHGSYNISGVEYPDAMRFSRNDIVISNRCGEFTNAMKYFGLNNDEEYVVSLWLVPTDEECATTGAPAGYTVDKENAVKILQAAIAECEWFVSVPAISANGTGSDVLTSYYWTTQEAVDEMNAAIAEAKAVLADEDAAPDELTYQLYMLYLKAHGSSDDKGAKFAGYDYVGFENQLNQTTGWIYINNEWQYFDAETGLVTGWAYLEWKGHNDWYYFDENGIMVTGWQKVGPTWYHLRASGKLDYGWIYVNGSWYYMNNSGAMETGWIYQGGNWYYLSESGAMVTGQCTINGRVSNFSAGGRWLGYAK